MPKAVIDRGFSPLRLGFYCDGGVLGCAGAELGAGVIDFGGRGTFFLATGFFGSLSSTTIFFGGGGGAACRALT